MKVICDYCGKTLGTDDEGIYHWMYCIVKNKNTDVISGGEEDGKAKEE